MTARPDPRREIDGDVYVSPRHLASSTFTGDPALTPLLNLDWDLRHDEDGNVFVSAPDQGVRLGYLPEGPDDGLWRINAYADPFGPPAWGVCFNNNAPTEFVTALTTALAIAYQQGSDAYLARPQAGTDERDPLLAIVPLLEQSWDFDRPRPDVFAIRAPDRLAVMEYTAGNLDAEAELVSRTARWHLWAGTSIDHPLWYATASTNTPLALLTALTQSVADPAPLLRWRQDTSSYRKGMAQLTPIPAPGPKPPTPLEVHRAVGLRRPAALPAASVPRWSTTSQPTAPTPRR
ncbi:DUF317 domain-containing protein [Streptomyces sp. AC563]|uniref:DUF317 domain-containing protein n=1 Tax=Streptomyces buecherae TaxID=2763006 RepID=UPI00164E3DDC|nr:DUF317 domain-containing protein [Streptomyces buecherae]MBC3990198.1 DUF317 domain-containing protein [Streptomyces buecherae]